MRTTLILDQELVAEAMRVTGARTKTAVIHLGLQSLIEAAARRRLAALKGQVPGAVAPSRRRPATRSPSR